MRVPFTFGCSISVTKRVSTVKCIMRCVIYGKGIGSSVDERVGLMILSHARGKKHKLQSFCQFWHACTHPWHRELDIFTDFLSIWNRVLGFYPHSSTAEATMLIRTFNVHVKWFICAHSKSPWILKFIPWNVLECPWILFWQNHTNPGHRKSITWLRVQKHLKIALISIHALYALL